MIILKSLKKLEFLVCLLMALTVNLEYATELIDAVKSGDLPKVEALLKSGVDIDTTDKHGNTALMIAVDKNNIDIVKLLLEHTPTPNIDLRDKDGATALIKAVTRYDTEMVRLLLSNRANPDVQNNKGKTALMKATSNSNKEIVELLLTNKANPDIQDKNGATALIMAATNADTETVSLLLSNKAKPDIQDKNGNTALIKAASTHDTESVGLLLNNKANPDIQNKNGNTALIIAATQFDRKTVSLLLSNKANPDIQNNKGDTAFIIVQDALQDSADLIFSKMTVPQKCCFLTFEQNDWNGAITTSLMSALFTRVVGIATPQMLKTLFEEYPFSKKYCSLGKLTLLVTKESNLIVILPESLIDLGVTIPESEKQKLEPTIDMTNIEKKYGFKNLRLLNPLFITSKVEADAKIFIKDDEFINMIGSLKTIIDNDSPKHPTRFYLEAHGGPEVTTIVAGIPLNYFNNFLVVLASIGAEFLYINSCYTAGTALLKMQRDLEKIITKQIMEMEHLKQAYKQKIFEYKQLMQKRMETEPEKYGSNINEYLEQFPAPRPDYYFAGIDYAIVIQATSGVLTGGTGNIKAMFTKLNEFLAQEEPSRELEFGQKVAKPKETVTITDVITSLGIKTSYALPSIRLPGRTGFFRSIDIGNMEIITISRLMEARVAETFALMKESESTDKKIADEAKRKLQHPLEIEIPIKPDIQFIQIFPTDLIDFRFVLQGTEMPKFISKLTGTGQHFIGSIKRANSRTIIESTLNDFMYSGFVNIFPAEASAETGRCWFMKSVDLTITGVIKHIKKLVVKLDPAPPSQEKAFTASYAYIDESGEFIMTKDGGAELKVGKDVFESTIRSWFESTKASQETLTEATGGIEITEAEKARLEKEKGGVRRLIEPRFQRTADDLFKIFMAQ